MCAVRIPGSDPFSAVVRLGALHIHSVSTSVGDCPWPENALFFKPRLAREVFGARKGFLRCNNFWASAVIRSPNWEDVECKTWVGTVTRVVFVVIPIEFVLCVLQTVSDVSADSRSHSISFHGPAWIPGSCDPHAMVPQSWDPVSFPF